MNNWKDAAAQVPESKNGMYMKLKQGPNKLRVLSAPIMGYEFWTKENQPVRVKDYPKEVPANIRPDSKIKFFWAFAVWNFETKKVEVLELTQATIISQIQSLVQSEEWGDPTGYSITITRKGEKLDTEYQVVPSPAKETPKDILDVYEANKPDLEALFEGKPVELAYNETAFDLPEESIEAEF